MSEHFVKSATKEPLLYVFPQQLIYTNDDDCFQTISDRFDENSATDQESTFIRFWKSQGEQILHDSWYKYYGEYMSHSETDAFAEEIQNIQVSEEEDTSANWSDLWQQHCEAVYADQYSNFQAIYYNYYTRFRKSIEGAVEEDVVPETIEDIELGLKLLGLPTSFGPSKQRRCRRKNKEIITTTTTELYFSDENSSDSSDFDSDTVGSETETMTRTGKGKTKDKHENKIRKKVNRKLRNVPECLKKNGMIKYWRKRFSLFSKFDEGIRLDEESWFSVTPEKIAINIADRLACDVIVDGFCGTGGNAIQFAKTCSKVIAIDIDPNKVEMAKHNAQIYGVDNKIDFIVGDFIDICENQRFHADAVFLSPPWGGPKYKKQKEYNIEESLLPIGASKLMEHARRISSNIGVFLPRNSSMQQVIRLAGAGNKCEVEHNYLDSRLVAITAYYGDGIVKK